MIKENATKSAVSKYRNFTFLIYPESAPEDWIERLEKIGLPVAISPFHNKDRIENDRNSENLSGFKKAHYHCIYVANNPVTVNSVRNKLKRALGNNAVAIVKVIDNVENMYLYLTHESKDAIRKKKYVYDKKDIIHLNNFDIARYISYSKEDYDEMHYNLLMIVRDLKLMNMIELINSFDMYPELFEKAGIHDLNILVKTVEGRNGIYRLFFDGNYQIYKREEREKLIFKK
ncbi:replication protein RepB [Streptococcus danieliae]|nr:replication protein RepB [Streptococcus danieliae]